MTDFWRNFLVKKKKFQEGFKKNERLMENFKDGLIFFVGNFQRVIFEVYQEIRF